MATRRIEVRHKPIAIGASRAGTRHDNPAQPRPAMLRTALAATRMHG
jgi:hypothetical protein